MVSLMVLIAACPVWTVSPRQAAARSSSALNWWLTFSSPGAYSSGCGRRWSPAYRSHARICSLRYLFEDYAFDTVRRELHRGADLVSVAPQAFDLLDYLIRNRERV